MNGRLIIVWTSPLGGAHISSRTVVKEITGWTGKNTEITEILDRSVVKEYNNEFVASLVLIREDLSYELLAIPEKYL